MWVETLQAHEILWALSEGTRLEPGRGRAGLSEMTKPSPFRYFKTSPEIIRLSVLLYVRLPLSLRNVEDLPQEREIDIGLPQPSSPV